MKNAKDTAKNVERRKVYAIVCKNLIFKLYVQVTEFMVSEDVRRRELAPLQKINDNYEKIVLSLDPGLDASYDGIKSLNLINWLLL